MDKIKCGDSVEVHWTDSEVSRGTVIWVPQGQGDMWHIKCKKAIMAVNPCSSNLACIVKFTEAK